MAQITDRERIHRISQLLNELNKNPPEKHEVERIPGIGRDPMLCPVISIGPDELLLNNRSHRVRAQLEDDPEWKALANDPHSEAAQLVIARYIREGRSAEQFSALKESLLKDGQTAPGLITHDGVLINGNTRAVAIREFTDPGKRYIRVAVLPQTVKPSDLNLFELRLQMQKELKGEYSLTNELLFVEELKDELDLEPAQIASELRIHLDNPKKGAAEVLLRLQMLDLIRKMQRIPAEHLKLTFFDQLAYQQMREVLGNYHSRMKEDPSEAELYLKSFLLTVQSGVKAVHQIRRIDASFMADYMLPRLEDDEDIGIFADALVAPEARAKGAAPSGVSTLIRGKGRDDAASVDIGRLINILAQTNKSVDFTAENKRVLLEKENVKQAVQSAVIGAIREKKLMESAEDKLSAPADSIKKATNELVKFGDALAAVYKHPEFDNKRHKLVELAFKKLKKRYREVETTLQKTGIVPK